MGLHVIRKAVRSHIVQKTGEEVKEIERQVFMGTYLNPGNHGFSGIRNDIYVDKSGLINLINQTINTPSYAADSSWISFLQ